MPVTTPSMAPIKSCDLQLCAIRVHYRNHGKSYIVGERMKILFIALACASTFLGAQNAFAAIKFKRFAHCGDGPVTVHTCECHASNSRVWHYCHAGYYCHTFDGTCRK
jgi:hypothetical protein